MQEKNIRLLPIQIVHISNFLNFARLFGRHDSSVDFSVRTEKAVAPWSIANLSVKNALWVRICVGNADWTDECVTAASSSYIIETFPWYKHWNECEKESVDSCFERAIPSRSFRTIGAWSTCVEEIDRRKCASNEIICYRNHKSCSSRNKAQFISMFQHSGMRLFNGEVRESSFEIV